MMAKTYLNNISVGLEEARFFLGSGIVEVFHTKLHQSSGIAEKQDLNDSEPEINVMDTEIPSNEKKSYTREEMGFFETPEEDVRYGLDTFRSLYNDLQSLAGKHPRSEDFAISSEGHRFQPLLQMTKDIVRYGESFVSLLEKMNSDNTLQRRELRNYYNQVIDTLDKLQDYLFQEESFRV